jgi:hypothetical protein
MEMLLFLCVLAATPDPRAWGRSAQQQFESGDEALWTRLSPEMQKVFGGSVEKMKQSLAETRALNGAGCASSRRWSRLFPTASSMRDG